MALGRALGAVTLLLTLTPVHRVLSQSATGRFGESAVVRNASNMEMAWWGILLAAGLGAVLTILLPTRGIRDLLGRLGRRLSAVPLTRFAWSAGAIGTALALGAGIGLFHGLPTLVDGMVARLQGRTIAGGHLSLELPDPMAAWLIPNTVLTDHGWVSQYPAFPAVLLAGGEALGIPWMVFPLLVGMTVAVSILLAGRLFPGDPALVRLGGVLLALSPFLFILGGGYLSHVPAAAFAALTLYAAHRALDGGWGWSLLVGAGAGAVVSSRPLLGLLLGVGVPAGLWLWRGLRTRDWGGLFRRCALAVAGGAPFALVLALYNRHFFGRVTRLGYSAAFGPAHDLGFHADPWGNLYSPLEALGFSSVDLTGLGAYLLETPIPATALVGLFLLTAPRMRAGIGLLLAWAFVPVLGNFLYWHHGFHLGPRMLYEAAPAWILLTALAMVSLAGSPGEPQAGEPSGPGGTPEPSPPGGEGGPRPAGGTRFSIPDLFLWSMVVSLAGFLFLTGNRLSTYRWGDETLSRVSVPPLPSPDPALVFVHGSWSERISARLQASGMRLDSIETALRRNDICVLHAFAVARLRAGAVVPDSSPFEQALDFQLLAESPPHLEALYLSEGNRILVDPSLAVPPACEREARADGRGIVSLAPLLWQGDLPGLEEGRPMFVRDLGPEDNRTVLEAFPLRRPYLFMTPAPDAAPRIVEYREGMALIWGEGSS